MSVFDDPKLFGRMWADTYDETSSPDPTAAVEFLAGLAGDGPVLELAIGTGRVAIPLAARGIAVEGIEASPEMIAVMRAKPGGDAIPVSVGDMADVDVTGPYPLVYLVYNTLFNLTGEGRQEDCFRNVARVLAPGGAFVIEAYVPGTDESDEERHVEVRSVTEDSVELRLHSYDYQAQTFIRQTIVITTVPYASNHSACITDGRNRSTRSPPKPGYNSKTDTPPGNGNHSARQAPTTFPCIASPSCAKTTTYQMSPSR